MKCGKMGKQEADLVDHSGSEVWTIRSGEPTETIQAAVCRQEIRSSDIKCLKQHKTEM